MRKMDKTEETSEGALKCTISLSYSPRSAPHRHVLVSLLGEKLKLFGTSKRSRSFTFTPRYVRNHKGLVMTKPLRSVGPVAPDSSWIAAARACKEL